MAAAYPPVLVLGAVPSMTWQVARCLRRSREALARKLARGHLAACSVFRHTRRGARTFYPSVRVREYVTSLAAACRYDGAGHLQLRYDPVRDAYFILGMSACFPDALLYAERAGLNCPQLLLQLEDGIPLQPALPRPGRIRLPPYERLMLLCRSEWPRA